MRTIVPLAVLALVAAGAVAGSLERGSGPRHEAQPAAGRSAVTETHVVRVELTVQPERVRFGDVVTATVRVTNLTPAPTTWTSDGCHDLADVRAVVPVLHRPGRTWTGAAAALKKDSLWPTEPQPGYFAPAERFETTPPGGGMWGCPDVARYHDLPARATRTHVAYWRAGLQYGGAAAGTATVRARFSNGLGNDVLVEVPIEVTGSAMSQAEAIDLALADPAFAAWLRRQPRATWRGAWALPGDDRNWVVGLHTGEHHADGGTVTIDPATGKVLARNLPAVRDTGR